MRKLLNQSKMNSEEEKLLLRLFQLKDPLKSGDLPMNIISEVYTAYCAKFVDKDFVDAVLGKLTIYV